MILKIKDIVGGNRCLIREDGQKIYNKIYDKLKNEESVTLDFEGITQFASPFFNAAVGQLLKDIEEDKIQKLLSCENLTETGKLIFERVIENAIRYYGDIDYKKIIDDLLEQQTKESE